MMFELLHCLSTMASQSRRFWSLEVLITMEKLCLLCPASEKRFFACQVPSSAMLCTRSSVSPLLNGSMHASMPETKGFNRRTTWPSKWIQILLHSSEPVPAPQVSIRSFRFCLWLFYFLLLTVTKGISSNLMKASSTRRRSKIKIEEEKRQE